jgi:hypothetical protein
VLLVLLGLHIGIEYAMNIPIFEHIMIISLIVFIPGEDAEKFVAWVKSSLLKNDKSPKTLERKASVDDAVST